MPGDSHSFAEVLQGRRRSGLFGQPSRVNWPLKPSAAGLGRPAPAAGHASEDTPRITARDATRSRSTSKRQSMHPADLYHNESDKRLSAVSVITQVRVPSSRSSLISGAPERITIYEPEPDSTPTRPQTSAGETVRDTGSSEATITRGRTISMSSRHRGANKAERAAMKAADFDYHAELRRMQGQDPVVKRKNKLEKMFGSDAAPIDDSPERRPKTSLELLEDELLAESSTEGESDLHKPSVQTPRAQTPRIQAPPVPEKSPRRPSVKHSRPPRVQHRPSNSIDRSTHSVSVASSANPESDLTNPDSDIFSENEDDTSSFTSGVSGVTDNVEERKQPESKQPSVLPPGAYASEGEHPTSLRINSRAARSAPSRHNQPAPLPPDAIHCYDMLAMKSPAGIERHDFGASRDPILAKFTPPQSPLDEEEPESFDLSRRPGSPALSNVSDESLDSALPPPVSLHREFHGPRWKNHAEQKRAYRKQRTDRSKDQPPTPNTPTFRGKLSTRSNPDTSVNLAVRPAHLAPRSASAASTPDPNRLQHKSDPNRLQQKSYFNAPQKSSQGFSWSTLFSRKKKKNQEPVEILPPLRKITFDTRGKKQVMDLQSPSRENFSQLDAYSEVDLVMPEPVSRPRKSTAESRHGESTQGQYLIAANAGNGNHGSWRMRAPGAPRRTAWK